MNTDNEARRVQALKNYELLDTAAENTFDRLTELASNICGVPISLITLLDEDRQWFKSKIGLDTNETPRSISFCTHAIQGNKLFEINDAFNDERFKNNPLVLGDPNIRFYAGYPLTDPDGFNLGTLCVIDRIPRKLSEEQKKAINIIAEEVVSQIISRKERKALKDFEKLFSITTDLVCIIDANQNFKKVNPSFVQLLGWDYSTLIGNPISHFLNPGDVEEIKHVLSTLIKDGNRANFANRFRTKNGNYRLINWAVTPDVETGLLYGIGRDITKEKEIEDDLVRTRELLQTMSQVSRVGGWDLNLATGISTWSSVTKEIHEVGPDFLPSIDSGVSFYSPKDQEIITGLVNKLISTGEPYEHELQMTTAKGNSNWVKLMGRAEMKDNRCARIYGIIQDINEEKLKKDKISVSEKQFRQTFDFAPNGMFIADPGSNKLVQVNEAFIKITGYTKLELTGLYLDHILHPADKENVIELLNKLSGSDLDSIELQCRFYTRQNELVWIKMGASLVKNEKGIPVNIIGQTSDITARIEAERKLLLSEEKHRAFFQNSQGLMCTHDLKGNFLTVNPSGAIMLGYSLEELQQLSLYDIVESRYRNDIEKYLEEMIKNNHHGGLMKLLHKNGQSKTWLYNNVLSELPDGSKFVIGNAVDITERIALERNLVMAKEIAVKNGQAKDVFLSNMSHEIRTPMNAITGFASLLMQTDLNDEQKKYTSYISTAGENLLGIINDILDFSKIESGHLNIESIPFNIKETIQSAKEVLSQAASDKHLMLTCTLDENLPESLLGDPTRLTQIIVNLINNALKFTEKGFVNIFAEIEKENQEDCTLHFYVKDSGIGIAEDKLDKIFDRFIQANSDTNRKYGGTGLGLSIVQSLVKLQGGKVWVESKLGTGSVFHFTITFKKDKSLLMEKISKENMKLFSEKEIRVLLVEDNLLNQKLGLKIMENFNFKADLATNGLEAIEKVKNNNYDVILMDLQMPLMDGYDATEIIRNELNLKTPILAMTAHSLVGERDKCISIGMNDYIPKPFKQKEVFNKIMYYAELHEKDQEQHIKQAGEVKQNYDISYLKSMSGENEDFEREMIDLFIRQTPNDIQELEMAIHEMNFVLISQAAHKLSSSFKLMGINEKGILKTLQYDVSGLESRKETLEKLNQLRLVFNKAVDGLENELKKYQRV